MAYNQKNILVFNCGSSSQGFTVFSWKQGEEPVRILTGKARNVATKSRQTPVLTWTFNGSTQTSECDCSTHPKAAEQIITLLNQKQIRVDAIGHRFVHGGGRFDRTVEVTSEVLEILKASFSFAPIHNPNSYSVIAVCEQEYPGIPEYAVFDTAFHHGMPDYASVYAIPGAVSEKYGFRKYGFHGLSYQYVSHRASVLLKRPLDQLKLVMCHLGTGGSSVCAFENGRTLDTSMGYSPLAGLIMSTRSGDIDPEILLELIRKGYSVDAIEKMLNFDSGLIGISDYSSNLGEIFDAAGENDACRLAFEAYVHRLKKTIGAFLFLMNGANALIFTDDAGERFYQVREAVCKDTDWFGLQLDPALNRAAVGHQEKQISAENSHIPIWVIPNDEERVIVDEIIQNISCDGRSNLE